MRSLGSSILSLVGSSISRYFKSYFDINSSKSFNQDHIHQLITERKYDINSKEIKLELDKILEETKNYLQPDEYRYLNRNYFKEKKYFLKAVKKLLYHFGKLFFGRNYNKYKNVSKRKGKTVETNTSV